jgi:23S rRNA (uridine2552-2'-O)-methyltransferase
MRLADARRDQFRKLAKDQGYRARSAYKLLQLNNAYHIIKRSSKVVDIGCAPGGWLQVITKQIGPGGRVVGIDLKEVEYVDGTTIIQGDIGNSVDDLANKVIEILDGKAEVVLSDLAPNVSGVWDIDHARQISLTYNAIFFAKLVLREQGSAIFKVFEGELLNELKKELKNNFIKVILTKPTASRQQSSELYAVCFGFKNLNQ